MSTYDEPIVLLCWYDDQCDQRICGECRCGTEIQFSQLEGMDGLCADCYWEDVDAERKGKGLSDAGVTSPVASPVASHVASPVASVSTPVCVCGETAILMDPAKPRESPWHCPVNSIHQLHCQCGTPTKPWTHQGRVGWTTKCPRCYLLSVR